MGESSTQVDPSAWVTDLPNLPERSTDLNRARVSPQEEPFKVPEQAPAGRDVVVGELVPARDSQADPESDQENEKTRKIELHHRSKFTDTVKTSIIKAVREGLQPHHAASKAGISRTTYRNWEKKAEEDPLGPFAEFVTLVEQAESEHFHELLEEWRVMGAQTKQWTALATLAERRYADDMAKRNRTAPQQAPTTNIQVNVGQLEQNLHQIHGRKATELDIYDGG